MNILKKYFYKIFKKHSKTDEKWLSYYSKETREIKFTNKTIYEYMKDCVGDDKDFYALNYFGTRMTYGELFRKINLAGKSLKSLGVKTGDIVTVCMPNTPEAVILFYAINKIGAVADMIHPLSAPNEVKYYLNESKSRILMLYDANYEKYKDILEDTNVYKTIITSVKESMPFLVKLGYEVTKGYKIKRASVRDKDFLTWEEFMELGLFYKKNSKSYRTANDLALILHSGGTTGKSKGIMISNYNFNAETQQDGVSVCDVRPKDKIMTILPIFHGFGLAVSLNCPLCLKVETILIPEFDGKRFAKIINKYKPNVIAGVPTLWEAMMSNKNFENIDLSYLKYIISGGDNLSVAMEKDMNKFLKEHNANIKISKGYGMTESVAATTFTYEGTNEIGSIGIPMIGNNICICEPGTINHLKTNEIGEICVTGPTVMMGYYNNKEETDKVLRLHEDGHVWLHTGDAGIIKENGVIYFSQRLKRMIVSSGFNVYPNVIEEVILTHPNVKRCACIGIKHPYKIQIPKVYIVLNDGIEEDSKIKAEIRLLCKKNLAVYSQPKEFEFVKELPKTLYNKIDYKKLEEENKNENK